MNRSDFQELARLRIQEAKLLLDAGHSKGAYYLSGYSVECALKACIAKQTKRHDFPDRAIVLRSHTHDLFELLKLAALKTEFDRERERNKEFKTNWAVVSDWSELSRYTTSDREGPARDLYKAITSRQNGVLPWLKKYW